MNITLRQLAVFSSVVRNRSFTRAAEELHLSQPAVSMQIKQLENQLQIALLDQAGRKIDLTEAGEEVFSYARTILGQLDDLDVERAALPWFTYSLEDNLRERKRSRCPPC